MITVENLSLVCKALNNWAYDVKSPMGSDIAFKISDNKFILDREFFNLEYDDLLAVDRDGDEDEDEDEDDSYYYNAYDANDALPIVTDTLQDILSNSDDSALLRDHLRYYHIEF